LLISVISGQISTHVQSVPQQQKLIKLNSFPYQKF
jgi:hypothetical protein